VGLRGCYRRVGTPGGALCLFGEENEDNAKRRFWSVLESYATIQGFEDNGELDLEVLDKNLGIQALSGEEVALTHKIGNNVERTKYADKIIERGKNWEASSGSPLKLLIIDPIARFLGGEENDTESGTRFIQSLEYIAKAFPDAAVVALHHTSKHGSGNLEVTQHDSRGSSALTYGARGQLNLRTMHPKEASNYGIHTDDLDDYVKVVVPASNNTKKHKPVWLKRCEGGVLYTVNLNEGHHTMNEKKTEELRIRIINKLRAEATAGNRYSMSDFSKRFSGVDGELGAGLPTIKSTIKQEIEAGNIENIGSNKYAYLQVSESCTVQSLPKLEDLFR